MAFSVYCYKDTQGIPVYVGGTFGDLHKRDVHHRWRARGGSDTALHAALRKQPLTMHLVHRREGWSRHNEADRRAAGATERYWERRLETSADDGGLNTYRAGAGYQCPAPLLADRAADICARYAAGETSKEIGATYGVGDKAVLRILHMHGVPLRRSGGRRGVKKMHARALSCDQSRSVALRYAAGENATALMAEFGVARGTILRAVREHGVRVKTRGGK